MERVRKMKNQNYQADEKMREVKGECEKKRYLKDTVFQLETLKWLFISFFLIIFGAAKYIKYSLLFLLVLDLFQTKYLFELKYFKYFKYVLNAVIIFLFVLNLKLFIIRNIIEVIVVIILIYIFNEKLAKIYNQFIELELDGGKNEE
jgi:hypothetical protein